MLSNDNVPSSSTPPFTTSSLGLSGTSRSNLSDKSEPSVLQPSLAARPNQIHLSPIYQQHLSLFFH